MTRPWWPLVASTELRVDHCIQGNDQIVTIATATRDPQLSARS